MIHRCDVFEKLRLFYFKHGGPYSLFDPWCIGQYWAQNKHPMNVESKGMNAMILKAWISLWNQLERNFKDQETKLGIFSITHLKAMLNKIKCTPWIYLSYCWDQFLSLNIQESVIICSVGTHRGVFWHPLLTQVRDCFKEGMSSCLLLIFLGHTLQAQVKFNHSPVTFAEASSAGSFLYPTL